MNRSVPSDGSPIVGKDLHDRGVEENAQLQRLPRGEAKGAAAYAADDLRVGSGLRSIREQTLFFPAIAEYGLLAKVLRTPQP